jgi:hypothetical protein
MRLKDVNTYVEDIARRLAAVLHHFQGIDVEAFNNVVTAACHLCSPTMFYQAARIGGWSTAVYTLVSISGDPCSAVAWAFSRRPGSCGLDPKTWFFDSCGDGFDQIKITEFRKTCKIAKYIGIVLDEAEVQQLFLPTFDCFTETGGHPIDFGAIMKLMRDEGILS